MSNIHLGEGGVFFRDNYWSPKIAKKLNPPPIYLHRLKGAEIFWSEGLINGHNVKGEFSNGFYQEFDKINPLILSIREDI